MAEQIAQDPAFAQMTKTLQESMAGLVSPDAAAAGPDAAMAGPDAAAAAAAAADPNFDPAKYMDAMTNVLQNPQFMQMAEKLGQRIMQVHYPHLCIFCPDPGVTCYIPASDRS